MKKVEKIPDEIFMTLIDEDGNKVRASLKISKLTKVALKSIIEKYK